MGEVNELEAHTIADPGILMDTTFNWATIIRLNTTSGMYTDDPPISDDAPNSGGASPTKQPTPQVNARTGKRASYWEEPATYEDNGERFSIATTLTQWNKMFQLKNRGTSQGWNANSNTDGPSAPFDISVNKYSLWVAAAVNMGMLHISDLTSLTETAVGFDDDEAVMDDGGFDDDFGGFGGLDDFGGGAYGAYGGGAYGGGAYGYAYGIGGAYGSAYGIGGSYGSYYGRRLGGEDDDEFDEVEVGFDEDAPRYTATGTRMPKKKIHQSIRMKKPDSDFEEHEVDKLSTKELDEMQKLMNRDERRHFARNLNGFASETRGNMYDAESFPYHYALAPMVLRKYCKFCRYSYYPSAFEAVFANRILVHVRYENCRTHLFFS